MDSSSDDEAMETKLNKSYLAWLLLLCPLLAQAQADPVQRTVETRNAVFRLNTKSCDLIGLDWKSPALKVIAEPRLGEKVVAHPDGVEEA